MGEHCCFYDAETGVTNDIYIPPGSPLREDYTSPTAPTVIMSRAIEQVEKQGYRVMVALVDVEHKDKPKEERLYTFCDIESKLLRKVIYGEIENEFRE